MTTTTASSVDIPCISGTLKSNASTYLPTIGLLGLRTRLTGEVTMTCHPHRIGHRGCVSLCFQGEQGRTDVLITVSGRAQFPQKEDYLSPRWYIDVADMVDAMYLVLWLGTLGEGSPTLLISGNEN